MKYDYYMVYYLLNGEEFSRIIYAKSAHHASEVAERSHKNIIVTSSIGLKFKG